MLSKKLRTSFAVFALTVATLGVGVTADAAPPQTDICHGGGRLGWCVR